MASDIPQAAKPLVDFKPKHEFFVGIDSDGCAFDTMEIKHKECFTPKFIKRYANCWEIIGKALADFQDDVRKGTFPSAEHSFTMKDDEYQALLQQIPKK